MLEWDAVSGRVYGVYASTNLLTPFELLPGGSVVYPQNSYTDTVHTIEDEVFFRMDVQPL